uniref:acetyl-CoA carboxylase carboxyltransferase beta subunit n=1 Tax=Cuscuta japonica TaxID=81913 RepID=UPI001EDE6261|nr:acetyl-CoA carboxylase carboxyltransferase beta subunit [Cuscuta japonica]UKO31959.1 acetyl-CoA carboxylase carboxyltransferase beta subunit [Cuscuta japonica]
MRKKNYRFFINILDRTTIPSIIFSCKKGREKSMERRGGGRDNSSCSNFDQLFGVKYSESLLYDHALIVRDRNGDSYFAYLDIENQTFLSEPFYNYRSRNSSYLPKIPGFLSEDHSKINGVENGFNNYNMSVLTDDYNLKMGMNGFHRPQSKIHINRSIDSYLQSQICIATTPVSGSDNDSYIHGSRVYGESENYTRSEGRSSSIRTLTKGVELTLRERPEILDRTKKYRYLWLQCDNCYGLNYKKVLKSKMNICEQCGYHLQMSSSDRIELSIDPGTWDPMDEDMVSRDPIQFDSGGGEAYKDRISFYQRKTGLTEAVQTGIGQLNGIPVAIGVMDFKFMGGSMGSVVGEKITRLIEHATNKFLPLIIVSASGGARMQEGSLSLMQMAKISSALYDYQSNKRLVYVSILTSPTAGGVTASFGMLGDIIIAEPRAYVAFAGKRVIEQTLNQTIPNDSQEAEFLFHKGLFDLIIPRHLLKSVISELFTLHDLFPLNQNYNQYRALLNPIF